MNCLVGTNDKWEFYYNLQPCLSLKIADTILLFHKKSLRKSDKVSLTVYSVTIPHSIIFFAGFRPWFTSSIRPNTIEKADDLIPLPVNPTETDPSNGLKQCTVYEWCGWNVCNWCTQLVNNNSWNIFKGSYYSVNLVSPVNSFPHTQVP